jgi:hypothetical protein
VLNGSSGTYELATKNTGFSFRYSLENIRKMDMSNPHYPEARMNNHFSPGSRPPLLSIISSNTLPITQTRQADERLRERWLSDLAKKSRTLAWTIEQARVAVMDDAIDAAIARTMQSRKSIDALISEGRLAADPAVRDDFDRLLCFRDAVWGADHDTCHSLLHRKSQLLVDIMRRWTKPTDHIPYRGHWRHPNRCNSLPVDQDQRAGNVRALLRKAHHQFAV